MNNLTLKNLITFLLTLFLFNSFSYADDLAQNDCSTIVRSAMTLQEDNGSTNTEDSVSANNLTLANPMALLLKLPAISEALNLSTQIQDITLLRTQITEAMTLQQAAIPLTQLNNLFLPRHLLNRDGFKYFNKSVNQSIESLSERVFNEVKIYYPELTNSEFKTEADLIFLKSYIELKKQEHRRWIDSLNDNIKDIFTKLDIPITHNHDTLLGHAFYELLRQPFDKLPRELLVDPMAHIKEIEKDPDFGLIIKHGVLEIRSRFIPENEEAISAANRANHENIDLVFESISKSIIDTLIKNNSELSRDNALRANTQVLHNRSLWHGLSLLFGYDRIRKLYVEVTQTALPNSEILQNIFNASENYLSIRQNAITQNLETQNLNSSTNTSTSSFSIEEQIKELIQYFNKQNPNSTLNKDMPLQGIHFIIVGHFMNEWSTARHRMPAWIQNIVGRGENLSYQTLKEVLESIGATVTITQRLSTAHMDSQGDDLNNAFNSEEITNKNNLASKTIILTRSAGSAAFTNFNNRYSLPNSFSEKTTVINYGGTPGGSAISMRLADPDIFFSQIVPQVGGRLNLLPLLTNIMRLNRTDLSDLQLQKLFFEELANLDNLRSVSLEGFNDPRVLAPHLYFNNDKHVGFNVLNVTMLIEDMLQTKKAVSQDNALASAAFYGDNEGSGLLADSNPIGAGVSAETTHPNLALHIPGEHLQHAILSEDEGTILILRFLLSYVYNVDLHQ